MKRLAMLLAALLLLSCEVWAQVVPSLNDSTAKELAKQYKESAKAFAQTPNVTVPFSFSQGQLKYQFSNPAAGGDPLATLQVAPGTWWNDSDTATRLGLTKEQQKKMDDIFQQFRLKLIDLNAALAKEELTMTPLIESERLDEVRILAQIDKIAQARAELEKANSRMLLGIRQTLTMEQWSKIQSSPRKFKFTVGKQF